MFPYPCPSCSQRLLAPADRAGQRTICPKCLRPLTIPKPESSEDPKTLFDPSEAPIPVFMDTDTPFPDSIRIPDFGQEEIALEPALSAAVESEAYGGAGALSFDLPEVSARERSSFSGSDHPRPDVEFTPPPLRTKLPIRTRGLTNSDAHGMVMLNPTGLFSVDMTAELTAALSMRMRPPPEPSVDRRLIVGAWAFGTLAALALWVGGLFYNAECLPFVALLGGAMLLFGLLWRAYLVSQEVSVASGFLCLVPPVSLYRLFQKAGVNGHRPLRFAASGAVALGLFATSAMAKSFVEGRTDRAKAVASPDDAPESSGTANGEFRNSEALRSQSDNPWRLVAAIREIGAPDNVAASGADDRAKVVEKLVKLLGSEHAGVREAAGLALQVWSPEEGDRWLLSALRGKDGDFRTALRVVPKFDKPFGTGMVADMLEMDDRRFEAQTCLAAIGAPAEAEVIRMLGSKERRTVQGAIDVLAQIGGAKSVEALKKLGIDKVSAGADWERVKADADRTAALLESKLGG